MNINLKMTNHMNKITWINLLHFYQPPTADNETVIEAVEKSYKRIISALERNPNIKMTLNFSGCVLEKLSQLGFNDLITSIKKMAESGQIELTGTAAYHPILPLLPANEIERNIKVNQEIFKKFFGHNLKPKGFFLPELAYSQPTARIIKKFGFDWIMLDQISAFGRLDDFDFKKLYTDKTSDLKICFRSRQLSQSYVPKTIFDLINSNQPALAITATDAELYGLRHADFSATFEKLLKRPELETKTISQFLNGLPDSTNISPVASSWESTEAELKNNLPFALWQDEKNKIQVLLWQLANLAIATVNKYTNDTNFNWARQHLDKGLASCTFWWASARDFKLFSSISWNPDEIERGVNQLIRSIRAIADPSSREAKIKAEKLYINIKKKIWQKHWNYYWGK